MEFPTTVHGRTTPLLVALAGSRDLYGAET